MPSAARPGQASPSSTARPTCSWSDSAWPPSTSCRPSSSSCPAPTCWGSSRNGSTAAPGRRQSTTSGPAVDEASGERLQKVLARAGFGSRRVCEDLVRDGRVSVDGTPAILGQRVDTSRHKVAVDGVAVGVAPELVHYLLNKPSGVVTTTADPQGRPTVLT